MAKKPSKSSSMRDAARKRAEERQTTGGGTKFIFPDGHKVTWFKPEKGKMLIDIIPYRVTAENHPVVGEGDLWYQRTIFVHHSVGAEEKAYLCLKTIGKRCPICDARAEMMKSPDGDDDLIKQLAPKEREVFNVIDRNNKKEGVQLWEYSFHLFGKLLETEIREGEDDLADFAELEGGKTLKLRFKEKTMGKNKFLECDRIDFEDREEDYDEEILDDVLDLDAILNVHPYEKLENIILEREDEDVPKKGKKKSDEEEDEPKKKPKKKPAKEEEDEEDEKPVRNSKKKPEPEEEDEKPTRASKGKKKPEPEPEPEEEETTLDEVNEMDYDELVQLVEDKELEDIDVDDYPKKKVEKLRAAIIEALELEEEEPEEKPVKKTSKKKPEPEDEEEDEKPVKKGKKKSSDDEECPHDGTFGVDTDDLD